MEKMNETYGINEVALMSGFTPRTLRNYLNQGLLKGEKDAKGVWRFTVGNIEEFFAEPFVKEGLRIKHTATVLDYLSERRKSSERACIVLDVPADLKKGNAISAFFCQKMEEVSDVTFQYNWDDGMSRIVLSGDSKAIATIMEAYHKTEFND